MKIEEYQTIIDEIKNDRFALKDFETSKTRYQKIIEYNVTDGRGYGILPKDDNFADGLQAWLFLAEHRKKFNTSESSAKRRINADEFKIKFCTNDLDLYYRVMEEMNIDEILLIDFIGSMGENGHELLKIAKELYKK